MAGRSKDDAGGAAFHNPFEAMGRDWRKRQGRRRREERELAVEAAATEARRLQAEEQARAEARAERERRRAADPDEAFRVATADVAPIAAAPERVTARSRPPAVDGSAARRRELEALDAAEGFNLSYGDGFVRGRAVDVSRHTIDRLARGEFAVGRHLDLHGYTLEDARVLVDEFLAGRQKGLDRCVLIVTGKGRNSPGGAGVLRLCVPEWIAKGPSSRRVLGFVTARPCDGGDGALYVLLRRSHSRKTHIVLETGGIGSD
jgi:DNA-nicking Smr family endonuclease